MSDPWALIVAVVFALIPFLGMALLFSKREMAMLALYSVLAGWAALPALEFLLLHVDGEQRQLIAERYDVWRDKSRARSFHRADAVFLYDKKTCHLSVVDSRDEYVKLLNKEPLDIVTGKHSAFCRLGTTHKWPLPDMLPSLAVHVVSFGVALFVVRKSGQRPTTS